MASAAVALSKEFASTLPSRRSSEALARVQQFMKDHRMRWKDMPGGFADFEAKLHEQIATFERELLAEEMSGADIDVEAIEVDGVSYRRVLRSEQTYLTAAGAVSIQRTLYKDRTDEAGRAIVPMDLRLGMVEGHWTPLAAKNAAWVVSQMTPQLAEELFERLGNMQPSKSSLDRLPKALSARWEEERDQFERTLRQSDVIPPQAVSVAISLDGVLAPMKDGEASQKRAGAAAKGRLTRGPAGYREVGCGTLSFYDAEGEMLTAVRMGRMPELKKKTLKRSLLLDVVNVLAERPDLHLVKLADGAADNWSFLSKQLPAGTEIADFFHAAEYLNAALGAAYGEGSVDARRRFQGNRPADAMARKLPASPCGRHGGPFRLRGRSGIRAAVSELKWRVASWGVASGEWAGARRQEVQVAGAEFRQRCGRSSSIWLMGQPPWSLPITSVTQSKGLTPFKWHEPRTV